MFYILKYLKVGNSFCRHPGASSPIIPQNIQQKRAPAMCGRPELSASAGNTRRYIRGFMAN
jgi:hypothetical protein